MNSYLLVFAGKAGTGKTTLAKSVSQELSIPYLDYDTLVQPFLQAIEARYGFESDDRYSFYRIWRNACYETVLGTAIENLQLGVPVAISAPFTKELNAEDYPQTIRERVGANIPILLFYMAPPDGLHFEMVCSRSYARDEDFIADRQRFDRVLNAEKPSWEASSTIILTSGNFKINKQLVLQRARALKER